MSKLDLKNKLNIELNEEEIRKIIQEYVAQEFGKRTDEITVIINTRQVQEGMQWDPYTTTRVEATVKLR